MLENTFLSEPGLSGFVDYQDYPINTTKVVSSGPIVPIDKPKIVAAIAHKNRCGID